MSNNSVRFEYEYKTSHESWGECYGELTMCQRMCSLVVKHLGEARGEVDKLQQVNNALMLKMGRMAMEYERRMKVLYDELEAQVEQGKNPECLLTLARRID